MKNIAIQFTSLILLLTGFSCGKENSITPVTGIKVTGRLIDNATDQGIAYEEIQLAYKVDLHGIENYFFPIEETTTNSEGEYAFEFEPLTDSIFAIFPVLHKIENYSGSPLYDKYIFNGNYFDENNSYDFRLCPLGKVELKLLNTSTTNGVRVELSSNDCDLRFSRSFNLNESIADTTITFRVQAPGEFEVNIFECEEYTSLGYCQPNGENVFRETYTLNSFEEREIVVEY